MSKVFRDFSKNIFVNKGILVGIPIAVVIVAVIIVISMATKDEPKEIEMKEIFDIENKTENNDEISDKLNEIEKIADDNEYEVKPRIWQTSGPFQIDRNEYALGEKIFIRIGGLSLQEKGDITVMRPLNSTHYSVYLTIPFDGTNKAAFNYYVDPQLSKTRGLCSIDDVLGKWALVFRGTHYPNLNFEIVNQTVPGTSWEPVC